MRTTVSFTVLDIENFKEYLLQWAQQFEEVVWLDSNFHKDQYGSFDALLAVDALSRITSEAKNGFNALSEYKNAVRDWIFGFLTYDLKNDLEELSSKNFDGLHFPELFFFQPRRIVKIQGSTVCFMYIDAIEKEIESDFKTILAKGQTYAVPEVKKEVNPPIRIKMRIFKDEYFKRVGRMLAHIQRGDFYEANFCQEFYAEQFKIDALKTFHKLNAISKAPFAAFFKIKDKYLLSASPERYIKKMGQKIVSQPIKGTARRSTDFDQDQSIKNNLRIDEKERSENIMIVDLVRNDLSKSALPGSVKVEELCEIRSFMQVHQMVSTISALVEVDKDPIEIIKETFPMGSMTGAPKISAMKCIELLESFKRGLYSGSVGYITPDGDFDFNVVIRSILYNASRQYVSFSVGSAITSRAVPEREYEECLLKAKAMREVLENINENTSTSPFK